MPKNSTLVIRLSDIEKKTVEKMAEFRSQTMSDYARERILPKMSNSCFIKKKGDGICIVCPDDDGEETEYCLNIKDESNTPKFDNRPRDIDFGHIDHKPTTFEKKDISFDISKDLFDPVTKEEKNAIQKKSILHKSLGIKKEKFLEKCSTCGKEVKNSEGFKVCPFCSSPWVPEFVCAACGKRIDVDWIICPFCG